MPSMTELRGEDLHRLDGRRLREQFRSLRHERGSDLTGQMRLPTRFVGERIKDSECGRAQFQRDL
jgi:hypothetical protein